MGSWSADENSLLTNRDIFEKYMRTMFSFNSRARGKMEKGAAAIQESSMHPLLVVNLGALLIAEKTGTVARLTARVSKVSGVKERTD